MSSKIKNWMWLNQLFIRNTWVYINMTLYMAEISKDLQVGVRLLHVDIAEETAGPEKFKFTWFNDCVLNQENLLKLQDTLLSQLEFICYSFHYFSRNIFLHYRLQLHSDQQLLYPQTKEHLVHFLLQAFLEQSLLHTDLVWCWEFIFHWRRPWKLILELAEFSLEHSRT